MIIGLSLSLFVACAGVQFGASGRDERPPSDVVRWAGYVFRSGEGTEGEDLLVDGTLTFTVAADAVPVEAELPYPDDYPGYWSVELPAAAPLTVRIEGPGLVPSVWAADAPANDGSWAAGSLFGADQAWLVSLFEGFGETTGGASVPLDATSAWAWGFWRDGARGDCAGVRVAGAAVACVGTDEAGALVPVTEGPFTAWFATGLAPGTVELEVVEEDVTVLTESWPLSGGDVGVAGWMAPAGGVE